MLRNHKDKINLESQRIYEISCKNNLNISEDYDSNLLRHHDENEHCHKGEFIKAKFYKHNIIVERTDTNIYEHI